MTINVDNIFPVYKPKAMPSEQLRFLLETVITQVPVDLACIYEYNTTTQAINAVASESFGELVGEEQERACRAVSERLLTLLPLTDPQIIQLKALDHAPLQSALFYPFPITDTISGVLSLGSLSPKTYNASHFERCATIVSLIRVVLENHHLYNVLAENLSTAQSILQTAQAIAENPSPQHVVNILRDTMFEGHISSCAMLLYGPVREDSPNGPFEYLELRGSWSRRYGSGIGIGVRLYLKDYPDLLEQLQHNEIVTFPSVNKIKDRFDPLIRGFLKAERLRGLTLIALQSTRQRLGVLAIGTDRRQQLDERELQSYRTVSEFLAISAMAQVLQQQHERLEQHRAAILDAVTDGVVMVLPYGQGGHVLTVNQRFTACSRSASSTPKAIR